MTDPNIITRAELAALIGARSPSYINELEKTGRAIRAPDGKHWLKAESLAAWRAAKDPAWQGVADRHAAARAAAPIEAPEDDNTATVQEQEGEDYPARSGEYNFQDAKAKREYWAAMREHAMFQKEAGQLMEKSAVVAAFAAAGATLRAKLESWQSTLPPQLSGLDEASISTTLAEQVERMLLDLVETFSRMASEAE